MTLLDENWDFYADLFDYEKKEYAEFEKKLKCLDSHMLNLLDSNFFNESGSNPNSLLNNQGDLESLIEKNQQLKEEIDAKVEELKLKKAQCQNFKQDEKILSQEIKDTHEAFLMAKKYYKKFLKLYFTIRSESNNKQTIFVQFFTELRKSSNNYSIILLRDTKTGIYELTDMVPKLSTFKEIQKKLEETRDMTGALCHIRQAFLKIKETK